MTDDEQTISKMFNFMVIYIGKIYIVVALCSIPIGIYDWRQRKKGCRNQIIGAHWRGGAAVGTLAIFKQNLFEGIFFHGLMELKIVVPLL